MKKLYFILILLLMPVLVYAAIKNVVPRTDGEGTIGTPSLYWEAGYFNNLHFEQRDGRYYIDATEADQGITGNGRSLNDLVEAIGTSKSATIVAAHTGTGNTTTYTLTTSETIPSNIALVIENGAILDGAGTLTINGPFKGVPECFDPNFNIVLGDGYVKEIYPQWWGAKGDGSTDDTVAIQAALNVNTDHRRVCLVPGEYMVSGLDFKAGTDLYGTSYKGSILSLIDNSDDDVIASSGTVHRSTIKNLRIDGNRDNQASGSGINFTSAYGCSLENLYIKACKDYAIYLNGCNIVTLENSYLYMNSNGVYQISSEECNIRDTVCEFQKDPNGFGVKLQHYLYNSVCSIDGCWFEGSLANGYPHDHIIIDADNITVSNCLFKLAGDPNTNLPDYGIKLLDGARRNRIINNKFIENEAGHSASIGLKDGSYQNIVIGNYGGNLTVLIDANSYSNYVLNNNTVTDNGTGNLIIDENLDIAKSDKLNLASPEIYLFDKDGLNKIAKESGQLIIRANNNIKLIAGEGVGTANISITADPNSSIAFTQGSIDLGSFSTLSINDATPSVKGYILFKIINTAALTTITMFDDGETGQMIKVISDDPNSNTVIDFTGTNLKGNSGVDWTPDQYDWMECVFDGTRWFCSVHDCTS